MAQNEVAIRNNYDLAKPVEMVSMAKVLTPHRRAEAIHEYRRQELRPR
jgi:hypothetical protein